jgi:hypothetical protein
MLFKSHINDMQFSATDEYVEQARVQQVNQFFSNGLMINNEKLYSTPFFHGGIVLNQGQGLSETMCERGKTSIVGYTGVYQDCDNLCYYNNQWWCFPSWVDCDTIEYCGGILQGCGTNEKLCCHDDEYSFCVGEVYVCDSLFFCNNEAYYCLSEEQGLCCEGTPGCCPANTNPECYGSSVTCCIEGTHISPDGDCWHDDWECKEDRHCTTGYICKFHNCKLNEIRWDVVVVDATEKPISKSVVTITGPRTYTQQTNDAGVAIFSIQYDNLAKYTISAVAEGYFTNSISNVIIKEYGWSGLSLLPTECNMGDTLNYTCPDGFQVEHCNCHGGEWACIMSPETLCIGHGFCGIVDECPEKKGYTVDCVENVCKYKKKGCLMFIGAIIGSLAVLGGYLYKKR